eukprot:3428765-Prymnesium_polylepis.1
MAPPKTCETESTIELRLSNVTVPPPIHSAPPLDILLMHEIIELFDTVKVPLAMYTPPPPPVAVDPHTVALTTLLALNRFKMPFAK